MINEDLKLLDNGGFEIHYDQGLAKLSNSDVKMKRKYKDRLDNNRKKIFENSDILAHAFSFQEAVQKMPNRTDVDVRYVF